MKRWIIYLWLRLKEELRLTNQRKELKKIQNSLSFGDAILLGSYIEDTQSFEVDDFVIHNNKWGENKLKKGEAYIQEIFHGDSWWGAAFIPPQRNRGVIGYPEARYGKSPFGGYSTTESLPVPLKKIEKLSSTYKTSLYIQQKKYNLAFDLWLTHPTTGLITQEIMIWEDYNIAKPFGEYMGTYGGYCIYHGYMDRSKEDLPVDGWYFTALVREKRRREGTVNIQSLLEMLVAIGLANPNHLLSSVEFGSEVYNSIGIMLNKQLDIQLKIKE